jgi:ElaB/YqjD/DUF883 family membrane-anchored ribosome-binding protein
MFQEVKGFVLTKFSSAQTTGILLMISVMVISVLWALSTEQMLISSKEEGWQRLQAKEEAITNLVKADTGEEKKLANALPSDCQKVVFVDREVSAPEPEKPKDSVEETSSESVSPESDQADMAKAQIQARIEEVKNEIAKKQKDLQQALQATSGIVQASADANTAVGIKTDAIAQN